MSTASFGGRVALVTGAARSMGQEIAVAFAERGARVVAVDVRSTDETGKRIAKLGVEWLGIEADVSSPEAVGGIATAVQNRFDHLDVLVNCAGILPRTPWDGVTFDDWRRIMSVNADSQFLTCLALIPLMRERGYGRIVNFTSGSVQMPGANFTPYKASKMAVIGLTRGLAFDVGSLGITVNAVSPAYVATPGQVEFGNVNFINADAVAQAQAIKRPATPSDIVSLVLFLASEEAGFITGQTVFADGGLALR